MHVRLQQLLYNDVPGLLCSVGDAVTSCTVGVAPDGVSGTVTGRKVKFTSLRKYV